MPTELTAWPDPASAAGALFFERARRYKALYTAAGYSNAFAFGMLTMAEAESSFDPNALGDYVDENGKALPWSAHPVGTPTSFGAHQRKVARTSAILNGANGAKGLGFDIAALAKAKQNTVENEVQATTWELETFPSYGLAAIKTARTAYGIAYQATVSFERAGTVASGAAIKRAAMAVSWVYLSNGTWLPARGPAPKGWEELTKGW